MSNQQSNYRDSVLAALTGKLKDLHRAGSELHANCPKCGHTRDPKARGRANRFFTTASKNYRSWWCRQCGYTASTNILLGIAPGSTAVQRPIVYPWTEPITPTRLDLIRRVYASLTKFSQQHLERAEAYLKTKRGMTLDQARAVGLGFINTPLYIEWYKSLAPELKIGIVFAGLPDVDSNFKPKGKGWGFVKGYMGKVLIPFFDDDQIVDIRTRSISKKDKIRYSSPLGGYDSRGAQVPYMTLSRGSSIIILTEGEFKSITPHALGCLYPIYALRGASESVDKIADYLYGKTVILAFDNDDAGRMANVKQGRRLQALGISVLAFNQSQWDQHKGIDDFILAEGAERLNKMLEPGHSEFIMTLAEYEAMLTKSGMDLTIIKRANADVRTARRWTPTKYVDQFAHPQIENTILVDDANQAIYTKITETLTNDRAILIKSPTGVGKTYQVSKAVLESLMNQVSGTTERKQERQHYLDHDKTYQSVLKAYKVDLRCARDEGIIKGETRYLELCDKGTLDQVEQKELTELKEGQYGRYIGAIKRDEAHQAIKKAFEAEKDRIQAEVDQALPLLSSDELKITVAMPNHKQIAEKLLPGEPLHGFVHIKGRNADNCKSHIVATQLTKGGYNVNEHLCGKPAKKGEAQGVLCPFFSWCCNEGYKSQWKQEGHKIVTHSHLFTDKTQDADIIIVDEASHRPFIKTTKITISDLRKALTQTEKRTPQLELLESLIAVLEILNQETERVSEEEQPAPSLNHIEFYEVFRRHFPEFLDTVDDWSTGGDTAALLNKLASDSIVTAPDKTAISIDKIPPLYSVELFKALTTDARRMIEGLQPSGNVSVKDGCIQVVNRRKLPDFYQDKKLILLNATANHEILEDVFEQDIELFSTNVAVAEGNTIIQDITLNNAKSSLLGDSEEAKPRRAAWIERIREYIQNHDESDVTLITVKNLAIYLIEAFPKAKIAWYGALEGKNDLQSGLTILCNPPSINLGAIQDEARALWPGLDTTLKRKSIAYNEIKNDEGHHLAIEQIDAVDSRLSALIDQHRDALAVQAIGRARLVRYSGRRIIIMFSRPIPGVTPNEVIYTREQKKEYKVNKTLEKLIGAAGHMLDEWNSFSVSTLADRAQSARRTVNKYWYEVVKGLDIQWIDLPCIQWLKDGGPRHVTVRLAFNEQGYRTLKKRIKSERSLCDQYTIDNIFIMNGSHSDLSIPEGFEIDVKNMISDTKQSTKKELVIQRTTT